MTHRFTLELRRLERDSHDKCSICGRAFQKEDVAHSGYGAEGQPLYVGSCCEAKITETAARYEWEPRAYEVPDESALLWRYMDFAKFVALLKESALYFSRADLLGDRYEGAKGLLANKSKWDEYYLKFFRDALQNPPPGANFGLSTEELERRAQKFIVDLEALGKDGLHTTFVSCWHESQVESEALWRLYCPPSSAGVAIRTTYSALTLSLGDNPDIKIGRVRYIDFRKTFAGPNDAIFRKRQSLSHEREVRAVVHRFDARDKVGIRIPIALNQILETVVVSPFAPTWFEEVLKEIMQRFSVDVPIITSELMLDPFF